MRRLIGLGGMVVLCSALLVSGAAADYVLDKDPKSLERNAQYNYLMGKYFFSKGQFTDAEQYFQRSRDMMERKQEVVARYPSLAATTDKKTGKPAPVSVTGEYTVGEGDVLFVSVWENQDMDQEVIVRPDGRISFPLAGDIMAVGRTLTQIDQDITKRLGEYIKFPEVSLSIRRLGGSKVVILGEVYRPGVYVVTGDRSILEAIALAGGMTPDAVANSVVLIRGGLSGSAEPRRLNLRQAMLGKAPDDNIGIRSEDIVYVPKTFIANLAYIVTQIVDPVQRGAMTVQSFQSVTGQTPTQ
jgi:polysaccharide export outer membrane protein